MEINVSSMDRDLKNLPKGGLGRVLAVYSRAVYLETEAGGMAVLVREDVGNGPGFALISDWPLFLKTGIEPGISCRMGEGGIELCGGAVSITIAGAQEWDARLTIRDARPLGQLKPCIDRVAEMAARGRDRAGLGMYFSRIDEFIGEERTAGDKMPLPAIDLKLRALARAIANRDSGKIKEAAKGVIGLGEGLTPACDDMLVGMCGFLRAADSESPRKSPAHILLAAIGEAIEARADKTTPVSRHFLRAAASGGFTEVARDVLEAIFAADMKTLERTVERLLEYGASSGSDLIFGIVLAYRGLAKDRRE